MEAEGQGLARLEIPAGYAKVNVTWSGQNGDLPDPVQDTSSSSDVLSFATEAIRNGGIPGIRPDTSADLSAFVVDRFDPDASHAFPRIFVRPKTAFGV